MSRAAIALWVCAGLSVALFVALAVLSKRSLEPAGVVIFDSRLGGYTEADARAYIAALTPAQITTYLTTFRRLDTAFPILLTISLLGAIWINTPGETRRRRVMACLGPVLYLAFDMLENTGVALMLKCEGRAIFEFLRCPADYGELVAQTSIYTQAKWMTLVLSLLVAFWAWRFTPAPQTPDRR